MGSKSEGLAHWHGQGVDISAVITEDVRLRRPGTSAIVLQQQRAR
jgi:hypothetical protein